ncbi:hypothetical protein QUF72_17075, partial [Desulfobacterales bacterium HSG2]|nr:hypothetical protein [Desulfobacterales bacterium HSG2]
TGDGNRTEAAVNFLSVISDCALMHADYPELTHIRSERFSGLNMILAPRCQCLGNFRLFHPPGENRRTAS